MERREVGEGGGSIAAGGGCRTREKVARGWAGEERAKCEKEGGSVEGQGEWKEAGNMARAKDADHLFLGNLMPYLTNVAPPGYLHLITSYR